MEIDTYISPISDESPCGENARYDPEYQEVVNEIQKLTAMSSAQDAINWNRVVELSKQILAKKSKDLTIAGYLCVGLFMKEGYQGVYDGLRIYYELLNNFWDCVFPKGSRPRRLAIEWLNQRVGDLTVRVPLSDEARVVLSLHELAKKLGELIQDRFEPPVPTISNLVSGFARHIPGPEPHPQRPADPATVSAKTPLPATSSEAPTFPALISADQNLTSPREIINTIRRLIAPLRADNPANPLPYRLLRSLKWDVISEIPTADSDGKTSIPAPRTQVGNTLRQLLQANNWSGLLEASEDAFQDTNGTFWLDLQRMTHKALQGLGDGHERASMVVVAETGAFLDRFPRIVDLSFSNGTPFADDETRQWIATQVVSLDQGNSQVPTINYDKDSTMSEDLQKAFGLASRKDLEGALEVLQEGIDLDPSYKGRFIRRLAAGKYCLQSGQLLWAKALLEGLNEEVGTISLQEWEPEVCAQIWEALYRCYRGLLMSKKTEQKDSLEALIGGLRNKLFQYNIKSAIAVEGKT